MKTAPPRNQLTFWAFAFLALAGTASCGSDDHDEDHEGTASGATCPPGSTLTYANFGQNFMSTYCTRCHSSALTGDMRQGAPADHNFDTLAGILKMADHIDEEAAAGPNGVNTGMPESDPKPSEEERRKLGEWLACETGGDDGGGGTMDGGGTGDTGGMSTDARDSATSDGRGGG
jgi:uncharacterized membrane protein